MNAALLIFHVLMDSGIAAHGAQKLFGWFEGGRVKSSGAYGKSSNESGLF